MLLPRDAMQARSMPPCGVRPSVRDTSRWKSSEFVDGGRRRRTDEVYDMKPQRYAEDNRTAFNCLQS